MDDRAAYFHTLVPGHDVAVKLARRHRWMGGMVMLAAPNSRFAYSVVSDANAIAYRRRLRLSQWAVRFGQVASAHCAAMRWARAM
jgi:hypothetical protein